ncbi:hypothetical protein [Hyphomicrobium sp. CS1BSMeth3]|uniref:hypothetical protein n=1 Tax=Hyphomicrobium sp. CS1BSMeth3 TaxID=1892844 RepID=UPI0009308F45|nr:hypothetical protein [Hyphomicrobium sp. CS1BSMeth3]
MPRVRRPASFSLKERVERAVDTIERIELLIGSAMHFDDHRRDNPQAANHVIVAHEMIRDQLQALRQELYGPALGP